MKVRIRTIFLVPILIVLVLYPVLVNIIFYETANNYMQNAARGELRYTLDVVLPIAQEIFIDIDESLPPATVNTARKEQVRDFLRRVKDEFKNNTTNTHLIVLDRDYELAYPEESELSVGVREVQTYFRDKLINEKDEVAFDSIDNVIIEGQEFMTYAIELRVSSNSSRYLIAYSRTTDVAGLLENFTSLIMYITVAMALISGIVLVFVSRRISRPIERLCKYTSQISSGSRVTIEGESRVAEIASLALEMNNMSERLRRSEEEQRTFYQNVAHELRTPLMSIRGYAEGMACGAFEDNKEAINVIVKQSMRLNELAGELMMLSELEAKNKKPELVPIPLCEFIPEIIKGTNGVAVQKNITVNAFFEAEDDRYEISADEEMLGEVLSNLLSNALRYAKSSVNVHVSADENNVYMNVCDDGSGLQPEDIDKIFERFYKGKGGNTGLGLAIVKAAITMMGGSVSAENAETGGAVFKVVLRRSSTQPYARQNERNDE